MNSHTSYIQKESIMTEFPLSYSKNHVFISFKKNDENLAVFLSCHIRAYRESTFCNCLNVKNSLFETGTISKILVIATILKPKTTYFVNKHSII